jgi:hypothetical protein
MYKFLRLLIVVLLAAVGNAAHAADETKVVIQADSGKPTSATVNIVNPPAPASTAASANACSCRDKDLLPFQKGLVLLPVGLSVLFLLLVYRGLKRAGYKLADALSENDAVTTTATANTPSQVGTDAASTQQTQTARTVPGNRSASRLVLFLSGITAIIISVCITTYYLYYYLCCGKAPDMDGLINVMLTLGIGVIPYAVNKVAK